VPFPLHSSYLFSLLYIQKYVWLHICLWYILIYFPPTTYIKKAKTAGLEPNRAMWPDYLITNIRWMNKIMTGRMRRSRDIVLTHTDIDRVGGLAYWLAIVTVVLFFTLWQSFAVSELYDQTNCMPIHEVTVCEMFFRTVPVNRLLEVNCLLCTVQLELSLRCMGRPEWRL